MSIGPVNTTDIPLRTNPPKGFTWQGNELFDVFQPFIGANAVLVYVALTRKAYPGKSFSYSTREMANASKRSPTTVFRSLAVLEYVGMARLKRGRGSKRSECELTDLRELAQRLGAAQTQSGACKPLPEETVNQIGTEIKALLRNLSGKPDAPPQMLVRVPIPTSNGGGSLFLPVSQRNAGASLAKRQRYAEEIPAGSHLLQQNTTPQKVPSPTPSHNGGEAQKDKDSPDEDEPDAALRAAQVIFTGVMKDMGNHLLDTNRPPNPRLKNGGQEWQDFAFGSLAVRAARWRGEVLELVLSASDPAAARRGLEKYHRTFNASVRAWYGCEVEMVW